MIIESILTTLAPDGTVNCAPMGVEWDEERIVIKPFVDTTTFRNLVASGRAVVNLTDDVLLFARGAIETAVFPHHPAVRVRGVVLDAACGWREVEVESVDDTPPRSRIVTRVVYRGFQREFLGFNRARHAVLEAAILATRTHLIPAAEVRAGFARLRTIVDKTAGEREQEAMALLEAHLQTTLRGEPAA